MVLHMEQTYTDSVMIWQTREGHEHGNPWVSKHTGECKRIASFKSKYNRLVAFDGYRYQHGMGYRR